MVRCVYGHVPMQMASVSSAWTRSTQLSYTTGMPNSSATRWLDSLLRLHTLTNSTLGIFWKPGMCLTLVLSPAPTNPIRIVSSAIIDSYLSSSSALDPSISNR